jgi:hypothetical protein
MRILDIIQESQTPQIYTIGDSHAEGMAYNKGFINKANGGQPSTSQRNFGGTHSVKGHPVGLSEVPNGSIIVVAQGANDTATSMKNHINSKGKTPLVPPATIASNVAKVVNAAKAKGQVIFILFPNGNGRAPGLAKYYSGDYQDEVRKAIRSAVGVPVVDLEGKGLSPDGIHGTPGAYKAAGTEVLTHIKTTPQTQPQAQAQQGNAQKVEPAPAAGAIEVPQGRVGTAVADIQKVLLALGYKLPKHGVDGVRGPETVGVIRQFQSDNGLAVDGDPGPETVGALNKLIAKKGITFAKSTQADVKGKFASSTDPQDVGDIMNDTDPSVIEGRKSAENYLGRNMSDEEWTALMKVTAAEEADTRAMAWVMAAILNRTNRGTWGNSVVSVVSAPSQFEPVTGPKGNEKRLHLLPIPSGRKLKAILIGAKEILPSVPKKIVNFTSNIDAAYKGRASISYKHKLLARGGEVVGNSVFSA